MSLVLLEAVARLTRLWVRLYTRGLPRRIAVLRRDEIESDIWEMLNDREAGYRTPTAPAMFLRFLAGVPADLLWRVKQSSLEQHFAVRRTLAFGVALALLALLWTAPFASVQGRREVASCADRIPTPHDTAALRLDVMRCAGAFFSARR
jgi:hypothetical protein